MSESSEDKTKRKYVNTLLNFRWGYQYSIFHEYAEDSAYLIDDWPSVKPTISRKVQQPFLVRLVLLDKDREGNKVKQLFISLLTTQRIEGFRPLLAGLFTEDVRVLGRPLHIMRKGQIAEKIANSDPHDLSSILGNRDVKRYVVLNRKYLVPETNVIDGEDEE